MLQAMSGFNSLCVGESGGLPQAKAHKVDVIIKAILAGWNIPSECWTSFSGKALAQELMDMVM